MKNSILPILVSLVVFLLATTLLQNRELREENKRLLALAARTQQTNQGFETSLISCRLTVDAMVAKSQEAAIRRMYTNLAYYRGLDHRPGEFRRVAQAVNLDERYGLLQARR